MTAGSSAMPSTRDRSDGLARAAERTIVLALIACGAVLIIVPLLLTLYLSLFDEKLILFPPRGYTLAWYPAIVPNFGKAIVTSLKLCVLAVAGSLALGIPAGIGLARHRFRGRGVIAALLLAPLTVPGIALGLAIYVSLVAIDEQLGSAVTGSMIGLVLAHVMITTPWVVRLCLASLTNQDRAAEEAAASLGAGPLTVIWRVTLPAMRAGIVAAALFALRHLVREPGIGAVPHQPRSHHAAGRGAAIPGVPHRPAGLRGRGGADRRGGGTAAGA